jgi:FAD/FMN-containing dehydrogenase
MISMYEKNGSSHVNHTDFFEKLLGKENVLSDSEKMDYGKDWTKKFQPNPLLALFPSSTIEVQAIMKHCFAHDLKVVPSGGRTGLSGGAMATELEVVVSTKKMGKIFEINKLERTLHCQAGAVTKDIQNASVKDGLYFPVDFASSGSSHIGGNIATNAGGIKVIKYGLIREWVQGLKIVLADGALLNLDNRCLKNNTGYDLKHLFVGSEGTLGIITECLLKLTSPPTELLVSLFALKTLSDVTKLFELAKSMKLNLTAYEFFTQNGLDRVREHTKLKSPFSENHPYYALVEIDKTSENELEKLETFVAETMENHLMVDGVISQSAQQTQDIWALRENISESITALSIVHKNDISLPLSNIANFCLELEEVIKINYPGIEVVLFGHIGDGNLHVNFLKPKDLSKVDFFDHAQKADQHLFSLVKKYGGSISAEHGVGLLKKDFLHFTRTPEEILVMANIKKLLDPKGILNPGKLFP